MIELMIKLVKNLPYAPRYVSSEANLLYPKSILLHSISNSSSDS